jgi:hypothetical protein
LFVEFPLSVGKFPISRALLLIAIRRCPDAGRLGPPLPVAASRL